MAVGTIEVVSIWLMAPPDPDKPVEAKRKSRLIGELKIEDCKLNI
jgi:hypothetical protein